MALASPFSSIYARAAQPVDLRPRAAAGTTSVEALLEVGGDLKIEEKGKQRSLPVAVIGKFKYLEHRLNAPGTPPRSLRLYDMAEASIKLDNSTANPVLREPLRLVAVRTDDETPFMFSPQGTLTREELELIDLPVNTLLVDRLLPEKPVAVGDTWQNPESLLAGLLGFDLVSQSTATSVITQIDHDAARIEMSGSVQGAICGVTTTMEVKGRYKFSLAERRITWLALLIEEKRSIGPAGPGADVVVRFQFTVKPGQPRPEFDDDALRRVVMGESTGLDDLEYTTSDGEMKFVHERRWRTLHAGSEAIAMRLVDRGDLVAQCNISRLPKVTMNQLPTLARFQEDVRRSLDKSFGQFVQATELTTPQGFRLLRVVVQGTAAELPIQWHYYHLADGDGHQAVCAFTLEEQYVQRFGTLDRDLVESIRFMDSASTASLATPAK
ncbi:MAG TPA: hypothetical protein VHZ24_11385 [Pirellulales bacterium]|jgi:hypothetical protein|nr:hypothetical protein [Pirellulales bacterium]